MKGPRRVGLTVSVGRIAIGLGDILVGDHSGIIPVGRDGLGGVPTAHDGLGAREGEMVAMLAGGVALPRRAKARVRDDPPTELD